MADLGLSRAEIGLLMGVAFIVVFSLATIAMGAFADRLSRPRLIAAGLGVWSVATALTGTATGLARLAAARALVGVGEATLSPSALAMLADIFPAARLGLANGVFYAGIPVGFACSFALAAWLAPWLGWRACFLALGAAGLGAVALVWRMADPPRRIPAAAGDPAVAKGGIVPRLRRALADEPALGLVVLGAAALAYTSASSQHGITWLVQERGFEYARAAWLSALVIATAGLAGNLAIGALTDRARRAGPASRLLALVAVGFVSLVVSAAFYLLPPGSPLFYACWLVTQAWMLGWYGPAFAAVQELAGPESRATVIGFALLAVNLLGVATGPWVTGMIGDRASLTRGLVLSLGVGAFGLLLVVVAAARVARARAGGSISR
jgi:MFS family permease